MKYRHLLGLAKESLEYRGRRIVVDHVADVSPSEGGMVDLDLIGLTVLSNGKKCMPAINGRFSGNHWDCSYSDYYCGYALLGDFILFIDQATAGRICSIRLCDSKEVNAGPREELPLDWPLLTNETGFNDTFGGLLGCVRCFDLTTPDELRRNEERIQLIPPEVVLGFGRVLHLDACGPAARVFVDGHGWRWLFPHPAGPLASLDELKVTAPSVDWSRIRPYLDDASNPEKYIVRSHFEALAYDGHHPHPLEPNRHGFEKLISRGQLVVPFDSPGLGLIQPSDPEFLAEVQAAVNYCG